MTCGEMMTHTHTGGSSGTLTFLDLRNKQWLLAPPSCGDYATNQVGANNEEHGQKRVDRGGGCEGGSAEAEYVAVEQERYTQDVTKSDPSLINKHGYPTRLHSPSVTLDNP